MTFRNTTAAFTLLLGLALSASAQTTTTTTTTVSQPASTGTQVAPTVIDPTLPSYTTAPSNVTPVIPKPPVAPVDSQLYAGAGATFGAHSAYGIVIGSTQVFGNFGAQVGVEYSAKTGAMLVDTLLTLRPRALSKGKLRPYLGVGLGLSSSAPIDSKPTVVNGVTTTTPSVTDYTAQALVGSDFMFTKDIAAYAEGGYRHAFSSKGVANGAGGLARVGVKFFF